MYCSCHNCHTSFLPPPVSSTGNEWSLRDLNTSSPAYQPLKRWAKLGRPSGARLQVTSYFTSYLMLRDLFLFVLRLNLLRRSLHYVVTSRTLHSILIGIVVNHGMLAAKIVPGRRRSRAPLERCGLPRVIWRRLAPEPAVDQVVDKNKLGRAGDEGSDGYPFVDGDQRLQEVIRERRVAADVTGHSQVMEWHKDAVRAHETEPEVEPPQRFVHHSPGHLGEPEVSCREDAKHGRNPHHHVEMADHEVSRMEHDIDRGLSQEESAHAAADEHRNKAQCKQG